MQGDRFACFHRGSWIAELEERGIIDIDPPTQDTFDPAVDVVYLDEEDDTYVYLTDNEVLETGVPLQEDSSPLSALGLARESSPLLADVPECPKCDVSVCQQAGRLLACRSPGPRFPPAQI